MKVTVSVHGRFHAFELARGLAKEGYLDQLLTTYPTFKARSFVGKQAPIKSAVALELRRRLYSRFGLGPKPDVHIARKFAQFAKRHMAPGSDLFVGWSSASLEAIDTAQKSGAKVIIERGSTHIRTQTEILQEAYQYFGLPFNETDPEIMDREEQEYALADYISVPSSRAAQSFIERGFDQSKLLVNGLGVDLSRFHPPQVRSKDHKPRILFVGSVGIRKGVPWLLEAFSTVSNKAELHLIGPVAPEMKPLMAKWGLKNVQVHGAITGAQLIREYGKADVFCLPSLEEGYGMVIPQAMACGLPVITTDAVGATDIFKAGQEGLIVLATDVSALSRALENLIDDAGLRQEMGRRALAAVQSGHDWEAYLMRTLASYRGVLAS